MNTWVRIIIFTLPLFLRSLTGTPQPPRPNALCTQVNGDTITITWEVGEFVPYESLILERSYDGSLFIESANILFGDVAFSYVESNLDQIIHYRLFTLNGPDSSEYSDTIRIMFLTVLPDPTGSIGRLTWNPVEESPNGQYTVYRQASGETAWQYLTSTQDILYSDTIAYPLCSDTLSYQIEYTDPDATCKSRSSVDQAALNDVPPSAVIMDSVSVSFNGDVTITWQPVNMKDIMSYIIYHDTVPGNYGPYYACDTVPNDQLLFIDTGSYALRKSIGYRISAVDSCGNESILDVENPFNTLFLEPITWNYCDVNIDLVWNSTESSLIPPVAGYQVFQVDTSDFTSIFLRETTDTQINYEAGFKPDSTYCFFVRAGNSLGKSSTSCIQCFYVDRPEQPDTLSLQVAGMDTLTNDRINIAVFVDTVPASTTCALLRKVSVNDPYDTIFKSPVTNNENLFFTDTTAQVGQNPYYYKTVILDGCLNASWLPLNEVRTIFLQGMANDQLNHLYWNRYQSTVSEVTKYRLYRKIDGLIDTIIDIGADTLYDDYVYDQATGSGRFSYLVEARIVPKNVDGPDTLSSFSNEIAQAWVAQFYMPTAFTPNNDSQNDYFAPQNSFPDDQADFVFLIYNRWGQKIYESTNISDKGWDGNISGEPCPEGIYVYYIHYVSLEGEVFEKKGTVTLLR